MIPPDVKGQLVRYFEEDLGRGDITARITPRKTCTATITANEKCTIAGIEEIGFLLGHFGLKVKRLAKDGKEIRPKTAVMQIYGDNRKILSLERVCLNILGRMSGVATLCTRAKRRIGKSAVMLAVTRKTAPGFQLLDKKAAQVAGLWTHRKDLSEMILLKDNHLKFFPTALDAAKAAARTGKKFEIEAENEWQAISAALEKPDILMLDNFSPKRARKAVAYLRKLGFNGKIELSGGITIANLNNYTKIGADIISMGELTRKAHILDFYLDVE
ncbi:MAG TPA: carboxylating nicotinate-nucleotide diphosphorylase [Candidatus Diapherotrites archaeon]|uniref:Nicotinate-nucleotide pyrophosphorylase [carboxylating] n=1 Tax=Candidatus Iainarchaeum sp. TaxID=3101447 RepID=A0A7J4IWA0_9ARCH|nr:carboxylating nicotinate-nucleotide diphosphorylase [Candidatus Diapherotrites archaeon]